MVKCKQDYIGAKFNHLTVIKQVDDYVTKQNKKPKAQFMCECDCKQDNPNFVIVRLDSLKNGHTSSCGCVKLNKTLELSQNNKKPIKDSQFLELNLTDKEHSLYGRCKASNTENYFYFSMTDYETIKDYCWYENITNSSDYHRIVTTIDGKPVAMHSLLGMFYPDHINRNPLDNRRENLDETATKQIQAQNRKLQRNNSSGCKGVGWSKSAKKWRARIKLQNKEINLGLFETKTDAIIARLKAEIENYDKRSWQVQLMMKHKLVK